MYYVPFQLFRIKKFMLDNMTQLPNLPYFCNMKRKPMYIVVVSHFSFCANNIDFFINYVPKCFEASHIHSYQAIISEECLTNNSASITLHSLLVELLCTEGCKNCLQFM